MAGEAYTLATWRVRPGKEDEFIAAWKALGRIFGALQVPPGPGTLLRAFDDASSFVSFGPWPTREAIAAMREDPDAQAGIERLKALCEDAQPGGYEVVATA